MKTRPLVRVLVSRSALLHNLHTYQETYPSLVFAPVLKSNAYGHGLLEVARVLDREQTPFFVLDSLYEARLLKKHGVRTKVLIIGYTTPENIVASRLKKVSFTVTSMEQLEQLSKVATSQVNIHLKIDTGMHRQGILPSEIPAALALIEKKQYLHLEGICSHFADADSAQSVLTKSQIHCWNDAVATCKATFSEISYIHISATAGAPYHSEAIGNVARLGIGLYGINPSPLSKVLLKPTLTLETIVSSLKKVPAGECVGYNCTLKTRHDSLVATVPVGYFEGVDRRLSNRGCFIVRGHACPIIGRVSMNITTIDVTDVPGVQAGDTVTVMSDCASDKNSVVSIATEAQTIPWDVLVHIPQHLKRYVVE